MILTIILAIITIAGIIWLVYDVFSDNEPKLGKEQICDRCSWQKGQGDWKYCMAPVIDVIGCPYNSYKHYKKT